jgi:hypothetical protein
MFSRHNAGVLSFTVLVTSFVISLCMGESYGFTQMAMAIISGVSPLVITYLDDRTRIQIDAESQELDALKANIQSLEAEVSRINLALKLRN